MARGVAPSKDFVELVTDIRSQQPTKATLVNVPARVESALAQQPADHRDAWLSQAAHYLRETTGDKQLNELVLTIWKLGNTKVKDILKRKGSYYDTLLKDKRVTPGEKLNRERALKSLKEIWSGDVCFGSGSEAWIPGTSTQALCLFRALCRDAHTKRVLHHVWPIIEEIRTEDHEKANTDSPPHGLPLSTTHVNKVKSRLNQKLEEGLLWEAEETEQTSSVLSHSPESQRGRPAEINLRSDISSEDEGLMVDYDVGHENSFDDAEDCSTLSVDSKIESNQPRLDHAIPSVVSTPKRSVPSYRQGLKSMTPILERSEPNSDKVISEFRIQRAMSEDLSTTKQRKRAIQANTTSPRKRAKGESAEDENIQVDSYAATEKDDRTLEHVNVMARSQRPKQNETSVQDMQQRVGPSLQPGQQLNTSTIELGLTALIGHSTLLNVSNMEQNFALPALHKVDLTNISEVVLPICCQNHWVLAVIALDSQKICLWNSLETVAVPSEVMARITNWAGGFRQQEGDARPSWDILHEHSSQQSNNTDCGVHLLVNALYQQRGRPAPTQIWSTTWRFIFRTWFLSSDCAADCMAYFKEQVDTLIAKANSAVSKETSASTGDPVMGEMYRKLDVCARDQTRAMATVDIIRNEIVTWSEAEETLRSTYSIRRRRYFEDEIKRLEQDTEDLRKGQDKYKSLGHKLIFESFTQTIRENNNRRKLMMNRSQENITLEQGLESACSLVHQLIAHLKELMQTAQALDRTATWALQMAALETATACGNRLNPTVASPDRTDSP